MENIIYYLVLYLFVIIIRFFKLKRQYGLDFNKHWYETFYGSLEIVYTASGFIIALLINVPKGWIAAVIVVYLLIVVFSAFLEMSNDTDFKPRPRTILHLFIISIIVTSTIVAYSNILPKVDLNGNSVTKPQEPKSKEYVVLIPYSDNSLVAHIGYQKMSNKYFTYELKIEASSPDSAKLLALKNVKDSSLIKPIFVNKKLNTSDIYIDNDKIKVIEMKNIKQ